MSCTAVRVVLVVHYKECRLCIYVSNNNTVVFGTRKRKENCVGPHVSKSFLWKEAQGMLCLFRALSSSPSTIDFLGVEYKNRSIAGKTTYMPYSGAVKKMEKLLKPWKVDGCPICPYACSSVWYSPCILSSQKTCTFVHYAISYTIYQTSG